MALIRGYFDEYDQPCVAMTVRGARREITVTAVIDTGFDGFLCLPITVAIELGLELRAAQRVELADGSIKRELVFVGQAGFVGRPSRTVEILLTASVDALVGVEFLADGRLEIDFPRRIVRVHPESRRGKRK